MNFNRPLILLVILAAAGISFAAQSAWHRVDHLYGYAVFGESDPDQTPAISYVSFNSDATESFEHSTAATAARAHFIVAGRDIYFDANNNRQPEPSERFKVQGNKFEVTSADGQSRYRLTRASLGLSPEHVSKDMPQYVMLSVDVLDPDQGEHVKFRQSGKISVHPEPIDQGWAHFGGPLSMDFVDDNLKLPTTGGPTVELRLEISTPPVEYRAEAGEKTVRSNLTAIVPDLLVPTVTIDFPSESGETITKRYDLDQFC